MEEKPSDGAAASAEVVDRRRPVVVAVDATEASADAVALGDELAQIVQLPLVLAIVYQEPATAPVRADEHAPSESEHALVRAASLVTSAADVELRAIEDSSVGHGIDSLARDEHSALIVGARSTRDDAEAAARPTTIERVVHGAPCTVAIAPQGFARRRRRAPRVIGCAFDGGEESLAALDLAARLARSSRAALEVITCLERSALRSGAHWERERGRARARAEQAIGGLADELAAEAVVLEGPAAELLIGRSADLDLLVCGSRAYGPLRAVLFGSVAQRLVRESACPLLVTPRAPGEAEAA